MKWTERVYTPPKPGQLRVWVAGENAELADFKRTFLVVVSIKELSVDVLCENEMLTFSREIIEKFTEVVC